MFKRRTVSTDYPAFSRLPVRLIPIGTGGEQMAVHLSGRLSPGTSPLICVPGFHRNMSDFTDFIEQFSRLATPDYPILLVDLLGRGRSSNRARRKDYTSSRDAHDLAALADAFGIEKAVFVGQGYGGQVIMTLAAQRPELISGTVLIDAGPVTDSRGLVRLRNNFRHLRQMRGEVALRQTYRQILAADYPRASAAQLDLLASRTHTVDKRGRIQPFFDPYFGKILESFELDDVLVAQWPLYDALVVAPLLLMRTELSDQLRREVFVEMRRRRTDAEAAIIAGQGAPALLDGADEVNAILRFVRSIDMADPVRSAA